MAETKFKKIALKDVHKATDNVEVFLFNVGQGDHIMVKFPGLQYGIIDFYYDLELNLPEPPALTYFKALRSELSDSEFEQINLAFFCISHTDKDHIKGIKQTIEWFDLNGVFIEEFWFGAAREHAQLMDFLDTKINDFINNLPEKRHAELLNQKKFYNNNLRAFFRSFEKWKSKGFTSARYKNEATGMGEYLADVKPLRSPSADISAFNIGPLSIQLDDYYKNLTEDIVNKIICGDSSTAVDKNDMSHILCIKFGDKTLIFGGDTHREIWETCLEHYHDPRYPYQKMFGGLKAHFVKVSHHGSKNSSSQTIWDTLLWRGSASLLGISSGRNHKYKHPHSETIKDIRAIQANSEIFPTNICNYCLHLLPHPKELHTWYKDIKADRKSVV